MILIPFAFDRSLLNKGINSITAEDLDDFLFFWSSQGTFYLRNGRPELKLFIEKVSEQVGMKNKLKYFYQNLSGFCHDNYRDVDLDSLSSVEDALSHYKELSMIIVSNDSKYKGKKSGPEATLEISTLRKSRSSLKVLEQDVARSQMIEAGELLDDVWHAKFQPLVCPNYINDSFRVNIVDRYCMTNDSNHSGLKYILTKLAQAEMQIDKIQIFTAFNDSAEDDKYHLKTILEAIQRLVNEVKSEVNNLGGIKEIKSVIAKDSVFKKNAHGRWIEFETMVCEVDQGCNIFFHKPEWEKKEVTRNSTYGIKRHTKTHRNALDNITKSAKIFTPFSVIDL